jgi:hypothetical protein
MPASIPSKNRIGDLGEAFPILGGADGTDLLELGGFQLSQYIEPAFHRSGGEHILVGGQQIGIADI